MSRALSLLIAFYETAPSRVRRGWRDNHSAPYINWRQAVLRRDGYKCTKCGAKGDNAEGKNLHVAHKPGHEYGGIKDDERKKQLDHKPSHGVTLCRKCHGELDYGKGTGY